MAYQSLYRKYRSQTFGDLVGQDHVVKTLQNAITSGRIAHAYLFTGPRGTGKTSSARLLAKALNAENGPTPTPSDDDPICQLIAAGNCVDVIEMDAASEAGVDNIREAIVENVQYQPMMCRYKIYIIDEVHDLSGKAFDALLKTVEEPPAHVIFILATTEYSKVPPTIRSRCQKFEFHRASLQDLVSRLKHVAEQEKIDIESGAINAIARMADGGYRDALTLLEQAMLTSESTVTLNHIYDQLGLVSDEVVDGLVLGIKDGDVPKIIDLLGEVARLGRDPKSVLESMLHRLGDLTRAAYGIDIGGTGDSAQEAALHETAARVGRDTLLSLRGALSEVHKVISGITLPRLFLEAELIRVATQRSQPTARVVEATPVAKAAPVERPVAPKSEPTATTAPEPAKPEPVVETPPVKAVVQTGDPAMDKATLAWQDAVESLGSKSPLMKMKLSETKVVSAAENKVLVEFARQVELDWVTTSSKRLAAVLEEVQSRLEAGWTAELVAGQRQATVNDSQAVELPLEGQKLADTVREIFGTN